MKKFRFLLVVAIVLVSALALCLTAGASADVTASTYESLYVGEYTATDGTGYEGEAYVVFGKVTGTTEAGIILERYATSDSSYATVLESRYFPAKAGRIGADGEFGIALYKVADGYYKVKVVAGNPEAPTAEGAYTTFSQGVGEYSVRYYKLDGTDGYVDYTVQAGSYAPIPNFEREGWVIKGWKRSVMGSDSTPNDYKGRDAGWGDTMASNPSAFLATQNSVYIPMWDYVGVNGDMKTPDTFKLNMKGTSYLTSRNYNLGTAGSVGVMSFEVLEDAVAARAYIGTGTGRNGSGAPAQYNFYTLEGWALYNDDGTTIDHVGAASYDESNFVRVGDNLLSVGTVMQKGNSVQIVYSPYRDAENTGWLHVYVKKAGASAYTLFAGYENLTATQAPVNVMPMIATVDNGTTGASGSLEVPLANFKVGVDTDGNYATIEAEDGIFTTSNFTQKFSTDRYVKFETEYVPARNYKYQVEMGDVDQTSESALFMFSFVRDQWNTISEDAGSRLEMQFTVVESNVAECDGAPRFGFGLVGHSQMAQAMSGRHVQGVYFDWNTLVPTARSNATDANSNTLQKITTIEKSASVELGMKDLLVAGTTIKFEVAVDITNDTENTGYIYLYYKTADMAGFVLAATVDCIPCTSLSTDVQGNGNYAKGYAPTFMNFNSAGFKLDMTITNVSCVTYDIDDNQTSTIGIVTGGSYNTNVDNTVTQIYPAV